MDNLRKVSVVISENNIEKIKANRIIANNLNVKKNILPAFNSINTLYTISKNYNLENKTINIPDNCILKFTESGEISNGVLVGKNTIIIADNKIFNNVDIRGTWGCAGKIDWFSNGNLLSKDKYYDNTSEILNALDSTFRELVFSPRAYYITNTLTLTKNKKLTFQGPLLRNSISDDPNMALCTSVIFTDKNIPLLSISVSENLQNRIHIDGGNFDVSKAGAEYDKNCIEILANESNQKIWGVDIKSSILGPASINNGIAININPIRNSIADIIESGTETTYLDPYSNEQIPCKHVERVNYNINELGYITNIHINCIIGFFNIGVKATNWTNLIALVYPENNGSYSQAPDYGPNGNIKRGTWVQPMGNFYNWCTDLVIDSNIINCRQAINSNVEATDIKGSIQAGPISEDVPLIEYSGKHASIGAMIFDVGYTGYNTKALRSTVPNAVIDFYSSFMGYTTLNNNNTIQLAYGTKTPSLLMSRN